MFLQTISLFISGQEIVFVLFIVVMLFGADKIPEIARGLGKGMKTLRNATNDIKHEITKSAGWHYSVSIDQPTRSNDPNQH